MCGYLVLQPQTVAVAISVPVLLALGWIASIILLVLGFSDKENPLRKSKFSGVALSWMGVMAVLSPFSWYGYRAITQGILILTFADLLILTLLSLIGGMLLMMGFRIFREPVKIDSVQRTHPPED